MEEQHIDVCDQTVAFLGGLQSSDVNYLRKLTPKEHDFFRSLDVDFRINKAYLALGDRDILHKFRAFCISRCVKLRYGYKQYSLSDYISLIKDNFEYDDSSGQDKELTFIYCNKQSDYEKFENWMFITLISNLAYRNEKGLPTVVLSERDIKPLRNSGEFDEIINLSGTQTRQKMKNSLLGGSFSSNGTSF